jgi:hypothetical protein
VNAQVQASLLGRVVAPLPRLWRLAALTYVASRSWGLIGLAVLATVVAAVVGGDPITATMSMLVYSSTGIALLLSQDIIAGDRTQARWAVMMQQPVSLLRHYGRRLVLGTGALFAILTGVALLVGGVILARGGSFQEARGVGFGAIPWGFMAFLTGVAVSAWRRKSDLEVALVLILLAMVQGLYADGIRSFVTFLLFPVDGAAVVWQRMLGRSAVLETTWIVQLVTYPVLALAVTAIGLRRLDRLDLEDVTGSS